MKCSICGKENRIVNECRCDIHNLPTNPIRAMLDLLVSSNGAIVCSSACSPMELAYARKENRFFVDSNNYGYVVRLPEWRVNAETALQSTMLSAPLATQPSL